MLFMYILTALATPLFPHQEHIIAHHQTNPTLRPSQGLPDVTVYGYLPHWTEDPATVDLDGLSHIAYFDVGLLIDGSFERVSYWTNNAEVLIARAHAQGIKVHLTMTSFDDDINNTVLASSTLRSSVVSQLADFVHGYGADGINIDIEGMDASQRENLNLFIAELHQEIDDIVMAMPAVDWSDAYDYTTLSQYASFFIMGYGYHWSGGDPGPVDPLFGGGIWSNYALDWTVQDYLDHDVPAEKIILGLPLYGRSWSTVDNSVPGTSTGSSSPIVFGDAAVLAEQDGSLYDSHTHTPYILYNTEQIWYGDVDSVRDRISWAVDQEIQGIGFWALGYENGVDGFWEMVAEETYQDVPDDTDNPDDTDTPVSNQPPIANAGETQNAIVQVEVHLDGSFSNDPDGDPISFQWIQLAGSEVELLDAQTATPYFIPQEIGDYQFQLTVSDGIDSSTDSVAVSITEGSVSENEEDDNKPSGCTTFPLSSLFWPIALFAIIERREKKNHARHFLS